VALRGGFAGRFIARPATAEVRRIVLEDAARIQLEDVEYLNRRCREPGQQCVSSLYGPQDSCPVIRAMRRVNRGQKTDLGNDVAFTFFDAGHISARPMFC